jgi:hypothetical protein
MLDLANPLNLAHPLVKGHIGWWQCLPGAMSGRLLRNLCAPMASLTTSAMHLHGVLSSLDPYQSGVRAWSGTRRPGGFGHLTLDGTGWVNVAASPVLVLPFAFTLAAWIAPAAANSSHTCIIAKNQSAGNASYRWYWQSAGTLLLYNGTGNDTAVSGTAQIPLKTWTHVAATYNGVQAKVFINGRLDAVASYSSTFGTNTDQTVSFGYFGVFPDIQNLIGLLDDVHILNRAYSDGEVLQLYQLSRQGYPGLLRGVRPARLVGAAAGGSGSASGRFFFC